MKPTKLVDMKRAKGTRGNNAIWYLGNNRIWYELRDLSEMLGITLPALKNRIHNRGYDHEHTLLPQVKPGQLLGGGSKGGVSKNEGNAEWQSLGST